MFTIWPHRHRKQPLGSTCDILQVYNRPMNALDLGDNNRSAAWIYAGQQTNCLLPCPRLNPQAAAISASCNRDPPQAAWRKMDRRRCKLGCREAEQSAPSTCKKKGDERPTQKFQALYNHSRMRILQLANRKSHMPSNTLDLMYAKYFFGICAMFTNRSRHTNHSAQGRTHMSSNVLIMLQAYLAR